MSRAYYLSSDNHSLTPEPRECRIVGIAKRNSDSSPLFQVQLLQPVEVDVAFSAQYVRHLLLAPIYPGSRPDNVDAKPFLANIFVPRDDTLRRSYDPTDLVAHPGIGQLHSTWDDAAKECHKPLVGDPVQIPVSSVRILGEQNGDPERFIKTRIADFLRRTGSRCRAYLARVEYDVPGEFNVALFVRLETGDAKELVNAGIGNIFREVFKLDQRLDIFFIAQNEEVDIAAIVNPFFTSAE